MALQRVRSNMLANNFVLDDDQGLIVGSGNNIYIDTVNNRVGINTNSPTHDFTVAGNIHATGNITAGGDITIGDSDTDTLTITAEIGSDILPDIDNTYDLGSAAKKWAEVHATTFYGDGSQLTGIAATLDDILTNGNTSALNIDLTGGTVTATSFIGDGSQLTGLASTLDEVTTNGATTTNSITVGGLIVNSTGALGLPVGTTAQRPTAADGLIRFNSDLVAFEGYDGVEWGALGGGGATYSATAPTTNLKEGDLWFDTGTTGELYVYSGTEWLSVTGAGGSAFYQRGFLGDGSTTAFNVYGTGTSTVVVYINGVFVTTPADYSYANGVVTFVTPPALNDEINVLVYGETTGISLSLDSLSDVDLTTTAPTDGQVLVYDLSGNKFVPGDSAADFTDLTGSLALNQIPDGLITPAKLQTGVVFVDEFTADGNTASFTLSQDPGSAAAIQVFVDSVPQLASNYTVVGTTLTLPANPANGSIVEVRGYGAAVAVGTVADLSVTTNKIANGAVTAAKLDSAITTDDITEGSTNLYYTTTRSNTDFDTRLGTKTTTDLTEGTNLYYTDARVDARLAGGNVGNIVTTGYLAGPATFTIDPAAVGDNTGTVVIAGNLQVDGTTTTINSTTLEVDDKNVILSAGSPNAAGSDGAGITVDNGSDTDATILYDGINDEWEINKDLIVSGLGDFTGNSLSLGNTSAGILNIKGGSTTSPQIRFFDGGAAQARIGVPTGQTYLSLSGSDTLTADVVIDSSGSVGIGTSSPDNAKLEIAKAGSDTVGDGHIGFAGGADPLWAIRYGAADFDMRIDRSYAGWQSTPAVSIRRMNGNVGIGLDTASVKLHIQEGSSGGGLTEAFRISDSSYTNIAMYSGGADGEIKIGAAGQLRGSYKAQYAGTGGAYNFNIGTNATNAITIDTSQNVEISTGNLTPGTSTQDLGSTTDPWQNIYTQDMHLSNESRETGNEIDGTKGNWTIQEGAEDLYIINNKTGKRFRFKLEELD